MRIAAKPLVVVLTKVDLLPPASRLPTIHTQAGAPVIAISAVTGAGVPELLETLWKALRAGIATSPVPTSSADARRVSG